MQQLAHRRNSRGGPITVASWNGHAKADFSLNRFSPCGKACGILAE
jgi:hypothetical protein